MNLPTLLLIALGLSMDAFAVAVASGATMRCLQVRHALRMALFFGGFQAGMPVLGWLAGLGFRNYITGVDHWVAFGLLAFIGGKMIYESTQLEVDDEPCSKDCGQTLMTLFVLSVATSIDALAVGLSFSFLNMSIPLPVLIIGCVTFAMTYLGVYLGTKVGHFFEKRVEIVGGIILVGIGTKILLEHLLN